MAKPSEYPDWATEDQTDPVSGQPNVATPPAGRKESGWNRREIPPRQWFNWMARFTGRWVRWLEQTIVPKTLSGSTTNTVETDGSGHTHAVTTSSATTSTSADQIANSAAVKTVRDRAGPKTLTGATGNVADGTGHTHAITTSSDFNSESIDVVANSKAVHDGLEALAERATGVPRVQSSTRDKLTGSGNWTVPDGVTRVRCWIVGAGGGGGEGGGSGGGGHGGGGGGLNVSEVSVTPGDSIAYSCGSGGSGGTSSGGSDGGSTTFNGISAGGGGGGGNTFSSPGFGGSGGGSGVRGDPGGIGDGQTDKGGQGGGSAGFGGGGGSINDATGQTGVDGGGGAGGDGNSSGGDNGADGGDGFIVVEY